MILTIDIGNTNIKFGVFDGSEDKMCCRFQISSSAVRTCDEYILLIKSFIREQSVDGAFTGSVISSVVPSLTVPVSDAFSKITGRKPFIIGSGTKTGFPINIDVQSELGSDIVSNVSAALSKFSAPLAVVDMGTATTIAAVNSNGVLTGAVIAPGCGISLAALSENAALLFDVNAVRPKDIIGKNSAESICSGIYYGTVFMIDGFIREIRSKLCSHDNMKLSLVATGGNSDILDSCRNKFCKDPDLTLKGAARLYYKNVTAD